MSDDITIGGALAPMVEEHWYGDDVIELLGLDPNWTVAQLKQVIAVVDPNCTIAQLRQVIAVANGPVLGPDDFSCKKCGEPVRYANQNGYGCAFDAQQLPGAGWFLEEEMNSDESHPTGNFVARYMRVGDRNPEVLAFRKHNCKAKR